MAKRALRVSSTLSLGRWNLLSCQLLAIDFFEIALDVCGIFLTV